VSDIALRWNITEGAADFEIEANDLASDDTFETAIFLSLFTRRRASDGDALPVELGPDRGGWWADQLSPVEGDKYGSRLWLLSREKEQPVILTRAREYVIEALAWLTEDLITDRLDVTAEVLRRGILLISVTIHRPKAKPLNFKYDYNWEAQEARRA